MTKYNALKIYTLKYLQYFILYTAPEQTKQHIKNFKTKQEYSVILSVLIYGYIIFFSICSYTVQKGSKLHYWQNCECNKIKENRNIDNKTDKWNKKCSPCNITLTTKVTNYSKTLYY